MFKNQNGELLSSLSSLSEQLSDLQDENAQLETELDRMMGRKHAVDSMTLEECEFVEKNLKTSLDTLEVRKVSSKFESTVAVMFQVCIIVFLKMLVAIMP